MMRSGLVSITFRKLSPAQVVDLVARAGLRGVEWGGDVHVPHCDLAKGGVVNERTAHTSRAGFPCQACTAALTGLRLENPDERYLQ